MGGGGDGEGDADDNATMDCLDTPGFLSEDDETCPDWVGYDCTKATEDWDYSAQGQRDVIDNCAMSCGLCTTP